MDTNNADIVIKQEEDPLGNDCIEYVVTDEYIVSFIAFIFNKIYFSHKSLYWFFFSSHLKKKIICKKLTMITIMKKLMMHLHQKDL